MTLYHGTTIPNLKYIKANSRSHTQNIPVAYFSSDRVYALICCRTPEENFVTAGIREDGKLHYFERFPDQLRKMYGNKSGYLYSINASDSLLNTNAHTYESKQDVAVDGVEDIPDVYAQIIDEENAGNLVVHRYNEIDPAEQKAMANHIRDSMEDKPIMEPFYRKYFGLLWDPKF